MKLKNFSLKKINLGPTLSAPAQQALAVVEQLRDRHSNMPYLVTLEPQLFQHWQSETAELWMVEGTECCAALKFHVSRREFGHLIRIEDLIVAPQVRGTRLIIDFLEHFVHEAHARWPRLAWVGLGDAQLDVLPKIFDRRRRNPQSRVFNFPQMSVHQAWSRLYVVQSQDRRWMSAASLGASWQASKLPSPGRADTSVPSLIQTEPLAISFSRSSFRGVSLAGIREWRWPEVWQTQMRKISDAFNSLGPPHPIVAVDLDATPMTKERLEQILSSLEATPELRVAERAVAWFRDPIIYESNIRELNQVLRDRQLSLQVVETRVLLMSSVPQRSAQSIYESLALQASDI